MDGNSPPQFLPMALTQGDSAGIGPEIIAKAFRDAPEVLRGCFVVGDVASMRRAVAAISPVGQPCWPVARLAALSGLDAVPPRCIAVLELPDLPAPAPWGQVDADAGAAAAACVRWAAQAALRGEVAALVTAPLHQATCRIGRGAPCGATHTTDRPKACCTCSAKAWALANTCRLQQPKSCSPKAPSACQPNTCPSCALLPHCGCASSGK